MLLGWLGSPMLLLLGREGLWVLCCWGTRVVSPIDTVVSALMPLVFCCYWLECLHSLWCSYGLSGGAGTEAARGGSWTPSIAALLFLFQGMERGGCRPYLASARSLTRAMGSAAQQENGVTKHHSCISSVLPPLWVQVHLPSDTQMCQSLRLSSGLSRGTFVELWISQ